MMAGAHPSEIELFEYVEGDLGAQTAAGVRAHLETCPACAATVGELERARTVLRASPLLELPPERSRTIVAQLPKRERERPAILELFSSPKRLAAVLVPVAAAVVAVVVVTTTGGNGGSGETMRAAEKVAAATAAELEQAEAGGAAEEAAPLEAPADTGQPPALGAVAPVASVLGPATDVAKLLQNKGLTAKVVEGTVEVTGATKNAVEQALKDLSPGPVQVFVKPG